MARPSAVSVRPTMWSRFLPVMVPTLVTWPTFSASSTTITGRKIGSRPRLNSGWWNSGRPSHAASRTGVKSTSPRSTEIV